MVLIRFFRHLKPGVKEYELEADLIGEFTRQTGNHGV